MQALIANGDDLSVMRPVPECSSDFIAPFPTLGMPPAVFHLSPGVNSKPPGESRQNPLMRALEVWNLGLQPVRSLSRINNAEQTVQSKTGMASASWIAVGRRLQLPATTGSKQVSAALAVTDRGNAES